jgi:hypothetical protein
MKHFLSSIINNAMSDYSSYLRFINFIDFQVDSLIYIFMYLFYFQNVGVLGFWGDRKSVV